MLIHWPDLYFVLLYLHYSFTSPQEKSHISVFNINTIIFLVQKPACANMNIFKVLSLEFSPTKMSYMDNE